MKLLDAVNLMLPKLGEHPVTSLTVRHPTLAIILPEVENVLTTVLLQGWWFNTSDYTAYPDSEKKITLGIDTLSFVPERYPAALRGLALYNRTTLTYDWDTPVKGMLVQKIEFDLLPESVAQFVWYTALVNTYITDIGLTQDVQAWQGRATEAHTQVLAEHLRNQKYSTTGSVRFKRLRRAMRA